MQSAGVSVIICCYNSAQRIPQTLRHIAMQEVTPDINWEVIIINNNSTDHTIEVAQQTWTKLEIEIPFKIVNETKQGLSYAKERGYKESQFDYIIYCDDDNWLCPAYIQTAYDVMCSKSEVGILGGWSEAKGEVELPHWFSSNQWAYAVGVQSLTTGDITSRGFIWGAGMVMRKNVFSQLKESGFTPLLSDRAGKKLTSGSDSEVSKWFILAGYKLWYDSRLHFKHFIPAGRLTIPYFKGLLAGFAEAEAVLNKYNLAIKMEQESFNLLQKFFRFVLYLLASLGFKLLKRPKRATLYLGYAQWLSPFSNWIVLDREVLQIRQALRGFKQLSTNNK